MTPPAPLVLLPGTLCDGRLFSHQQRALRRLSGAQSQSVILVNYNRLKVSRSQPALSAWATQLLRELPKNFSLAGFSLGGIWALEILRQAPERVNRLAMIASNAQGASQKGLRNSCIQKRLWKRSDAGPLAVLKRGLPAYFHHESSRKKFQPLLQTMAIDMPSRSALAQFAWAGSRPEGFQALSNFSGPVLLVSGAKDRLCPPHWQQAMKNAQPQAQWIALERIGHFVPLEAPASLSQAFKKWLQTPSPCSDNLNQEGELNVE